MAEPNAVSLSHYSPGRLRLKAAALKKDQAMAEQVREALEAVPGITAVTARALTGSLLIEFLPDELALPDASRRLIAALGALFPDAFGTDSISVKINGLQSGDRIARRLKEKLSTVDAIRRIDIDHGEIKLEYDPNALSIPCVLDKLAD